MVLARNDKRTQKTTTCGGFLSVVLCTDMAQLPNIISKERSLWTVLKFVFKESMDASKKYSVIKYVTAILSSVFIVAQFGAFGMIVNEFVTQGIDGVRALVLLKGFAVLVIAQFGPDIVDTIHYYASSIQTNDMVRHLQALFFDRIRTLDIGTIEQPEFQNKYEISEGRGWGSFFNTTALFSNSIRMTTKVTVSLIALLAISPLVSLIILLGTIPTYLFEKKNASISAEIHNSNSEKWRIWKAKAGVLSEKDSITELKNFQIVNVFKKKFLSFIESFHVILKLNHLRKMKTDIFSVIVLGISYGIAFIILIQNVRSGIIQVGSLVFSFGLVTQFQMSINALLSNFGKMTEHKKNINTMLDILEMEPLVKSGVRKITQDEFQKLELKNVSFTYPGSDKNVIHNMNLIIEKPMNLAIVGLNGAGKTTLLKLITRVYDPTEGEILVNGINLKEYDLDDWKRCMGILLQEYSLYAEETIVENVMLGDVTKHDMDLVIHSAQQTTADVFIQELPEKYEQRVGTEFRGGVELSKGQKQKLALARVLYRNAPIIILDEPTAAIDALSEDTIFKSLRENHTDQTRIIISHKFSNVRDADTIILVEHGTIIEQGSHSELMSINNGRYKELFELQAEGYK